MGESAPESGAGSKYGVTLVRGPFVQLPPNAEECDEDDFLAYAARLRAGGARLAADLFSGAGGLSLGLEAAGYRVVLGVDRDREAAETHRHHFGGLTLDWDLGQPDRVTGSPISYGTRAWNCSQEDRRASHSLGPGGTRSGTAF